MQAEARAALAARASYGRLVALLAARYGDIAGAEDALADAFVAALETWPRDGVPERPEAWLMRVAKNRGLDVLRRTARSPVRTVDEVPEMAQELTETEEFPDRRLALMFVCAHPAIDAGVHTALMLQTVLGFEATDIGRCFVVSPTAIAQRLVRAKRKIKDTRIAFVEPERAAMAERLPPVLEAIYGAYALDWLHEGRDMSEEACFLSQLLVELLPDEPEALGNAALIAYAHARRHARFREGMLVPLDEQDASLWDAALISKAEAYLRRASSLRRLGRFQLEAAIQQAQLHGHNIGQTDWRGVLLLSEGLCRMWPSLGAEVSKAVAVAHVFGDAAGLSALRALPPAAVSGFQPWHAAHAYLLARLGKPSEARDAYAKAISLTVDSASRKWLEMKRAALG